MNRLTSLFQYRSALILVPVLLSLFTINIAPVSASTEATFRWEPNPPQEFVAGYRLYYGFQSRFNSDKSLKKNFSYNYRIDFVDQTRCTGPDFSSCIHLNSNDLQCQGLFAENPKCTVSNLSEGLYFAMTAYTNSAESSYTYELKSPTSPGGIPGDGPGKNPGNSPGNSPNFLPAINLLLLKK